MKKNEVSSDVVKVVEKMKKLGVLGKIVSLGSRNLAVITKAQELFSKKHSIQTGDGLTRKELRYLERKKLVKKIPIYGERKYRDTNPTLSYLWEWIGK